MANHPVKGHWRASDAGSARASDAGIGLDRVVACLDGSELGERAIPHALAVARALGARTTLLCVLEDRASGAAPPDPVEWDIRRREIREYIARLTQERDAESSPVDAEVIEGQPAEEICRWTRHQGIGLTVLCTHGARGETRWNLASTARKLVEGAPGSVLLVPTTAPRQPGVAAYRRILAPVDGSPRAESVIPLARRLAKAHGADLILAHVVPVPELTEIGPPDPEAVELRERLMQRNESVANEYLDRLRAQFADSEIPVRALALSGGDARSRLTRLIADEGVDLVVLSAHGRTARSDVSLGSVAAYLVAHAGAPLLIVRPSPAVAMRRVGPVDREGARLPSQATP